jgi:hypothetical protein
MNTYEAAKEEALDYILDTCDGPVTPFVVMARAVELARKAGPHQGCDDPVANALDEALGTLSAGDLPSEEFSQPLWGDLENDRDGDTL